MDLNATKMSALLTGTFSSVGLFLSEIKAVVAQNRSVTVEALLISIDRSAFRIVYGVSKEPLHFNGSLKLKSSATRSFTRPIPVPGRLDRKQKERSD